MSSLSPFQNSLISYNQQAKASNQYGRNLGTSGATNIFPQPVDSLKTFRNKLPIALFNMEFSLEVLVMGELSLYSSLLGKISGHISNRVTSHFFFRICIFF